MTQQCYRYGVYRRQDGDLVPARYPDGDLVYKVGLTDHRVRDGAISAAQECADREPGVVFYVTDTSGALVREVTAVAPCPF